MSKQEQNQDLLSLVHSQNRHTRQHSSSTEDLLLNIFKHFLLFPPLLFINYVVTEAEKPITY